MPAVSPISRRRTFAIISHPDAGKTTLTEKLLLFGGAIQLAGEVKAKKSRRETRSDWMELERERGISVVTSVMTFEYGNCIFNLLDTPGHEDFSEDTYRTLSAVDSAVMVIDAAKGIEARTRKLFEVCRLRDIPIITFINKMDRDGRHPFELLEEIEKTLALDTAPLSWPLGSGRTFAGVYDLGKNVVRRIDVLDEAPRPVAELTPAAFAEYLPDTDAALAAEEIALAKAACHPFDMKAFRQGNLTPVLFGSALRNFGVRDLIERLAAIAPPPEARKAEERVVEPDEPAMTGLVFKIQANMDPNHRDRIAFVRVCSGKLTRGMKAKLMRTGKPMSLNAPQFFFARERTTAEEAWPGDIVGIPNHGTLRIGDTLTEGETLNFGGVPSFAPEILRRVRVADAMRAKKLREALHQMAEEGVMQVFALLDGSPQIVGVVGALQLDVLKARLASEYDLEIEFEQPRFTVGRWIAAENPADRDAFIASHRGDMAEDLDGAPVFLAPSQFLLNYEIERAPKIVFSDVKDYQRHSADA
jgi:peptide chain release factor 3